MTSLTINLCAEDRIRFDVDGALVLDLEALKDTEADRLEELDKGLGMAVAAFLPHLESGSMGLAQAGRVAVWLALQQVGKDVVFGACTPRLLRATFERAVDAGPPAGPSESSSEDAPRSSS